MHVFRIVLLDMMRAGMVTVRFFCACHCIEAHVETLLHRLG